jgi:hypothetical protein
LTPGLRVTCLVCPFPATVELRQHEKTFWQEVLHMPLRIAQVCDQHVPHGLHYVRTGERRWAPVRSRRRGKP